MNRLHRGFAARAILAGLGAAMVVTAGAARADEWKVVDDSRWCSGSHGDRDFCEVREVTIKSNGKMITVDGRANGGIEVEGWDGKEIRVQAKVTVWADGDRDEARDIASRIVVQTAGSIRAEGPGQRHHEGWSVSYRIMVPHKSDLDLETNNGGISVEDVAGKIRVDANNGGIHLARLGGDVSGRTTNGGLKIELIGSKWDGAGLDVRSTNGGVSMEIPENYSAELETGTVNGGISIDFPITVEGDLNRSIRATLGKGGAPIRVKTTNGGVHITRS